MMSDKNVIIIRGVPGSGKSSLAELISGGDKNIVCESDQFMHNDKGEYEFDFNRLRETHSRCLGKFKTLVDLDTPLVIVSNTSTTTKEFKDYRKYAEDKGYRVAVIIVENYHGNKSVHDVPEDKMDAMRNRFQVNV